MRNLLQHCKAFYKSTLQYSVCSEKCTYVNDIFRSTLPFVSVEQGSQNVIEDWQKLLQVRSLVFAPQDDLRTWLKYASLCRRNGRLVCFSRSYYPFVVCEVKFSLWSFEMLLEGRNPLRRTRMFSPQSECASCHQQVKLCCNKILQFHVVLCNGRRTVAYCYLLMQVQPSKQCTAVSDKNCKWS